MDYNIKISEFEGPLDLLIHLIKKSNINIYDIDIYDITNQYLDYLHHMEELNIEIASSFLVMAAELIEIKSKLLLPMEEKEESTDEEEISRENLINKLINYQKYKELTPTLKELEEKRNEIYIKMPENINHYKENMVINKVLNVDELFEAFKLFLLRQKASKPLKTKITTKEYHVSERIIEIKNILKMKKKVYFDELFDNFQKDYVVVTFLSILEMAKDNSLCLKQERNFEKIYLELK